MATTANIVGPVANCMPTRNTLQTKRLFQVNNTSQAYFNSQYYLLQGEGLWSGEHSQEVLMPQDLIAYLPLSSARAIGLGTNVVQNEFDWPD